MSILKAEKASGTVPSVGVCPDSACEFAILFYLFFSVETSVLKNYFRSVKAEALQGQLMLFYCILL